MTNGITANITIWTKHGSKPSGAGKIVATLHGTPMRGQRSVNYDHAAGPLLNHLLAARKLAEAFGLTLLTTPPGISFPAGDLDGGGYYWEATS